MKRNMKSTMTRSPKHTLGQSLIKRGISFGVMASLLVLAGGSFILPQAGGLVAHAQTMSSKAIVDQAKRQGKIGERIDGYLASTGASLAPSVSAAMNEINIRRKSVYSKLAARQGVELSVVAHLSGEKLIAKAPVGQKIFGTDRRWSTK